MLPNYLNKIKWIRHRDLKLNMQEDSKRAKQAQVGHLYWKIYTPVDRKRRTLTNTYIIVIAHTKEFFIKLGGSYPSTTVFQLKWYPIGPCSSLQPTKPSSGAPMGQSSSLKPIGPSFLLKPTKLSTSSGSLMEKIPCYGLPN